jgi:hypothetical protein
LSIKSPCLAQGPDMGAISPTLTSAVCAWMGDAHPTLNATAAKAVLTRKDSFQFAMTLFLPIAVFR